MNKVTNENLEKILGSLYHICKLSVFDLSQSPILLKEIEEITDPNAIYSFIPLMFVKNKTVSRVVNQKVNALFNTIPLDLLSKIDENIRNSNYLKNNEQIFEYWYGLKPSIVDSYKSHSIEFSIILKTLSCHPNGYIRYEAIKTLAKNNIQDAIPFLIIRANDWVEEIRILCLDILNSITRNEITCHFVESLPLLKQLKTKGRKVHMCDRIELLRKIESLLASQCSDALLKKVNTCNIISARYAFDILTNDDSKLERLLTITLNNRDILIKIKAFNLAYKWYDPNQFLIYLNKIKNDKLMPIRKRVLYAFVEHYPHHSKNVLEDALLDRSRSIRNLSRYYLKQQGISEFSSYYRDALAKNDETIKLAILGFSESGNKHDFKYIRPFITKNISALNAVIIKAAFKMQPQDWKKVISQLLAHPEPANLKSFARCISENYESYTFEEILELVYKKNNPMSIRYFIKILSNGHYDRWMVLNFILCELEMVIVQDIQVAFEKYLHTWIQHNSPNKVFIRPSYEKLKVCLDKTSNLQKHNPTSLIYKELLENIKNFM